MNSLENMNEDKVETIDINNTVEDVKYIVIDDLSDNPSDIPLEYKELVELYEKATGLEVHISLSDDIERVLRSANKRWDLVGDAYDIYQLADQAYKISSLFVDKKEDEAFREMRRFGYSTFFSTVMSVGMKMLFVAVGMNPFVAFALAFGIGIMFSNMGEFMSDMIDEIFDLFDDAGAFTFPIDPLIFDLDGDGIETTSLENGVNFDFDQNGFAEKISWVGMDDGLLVRDLNGNGNIDNGGELFGDLTTIAEGVTAVNGFEALKAFDTNGDGVIDSNDAIYSELKIWKDANQNGVVDEGELLSLESLDIVSIDLNYTNIDEIDEQGNSHSQKSYYTDSEGNRHVIEDVWFEKDAADTVVVEDREFELLEETEAIATLPDIDGSGNQYSLHQAMLRDESGLLQQLVEQYVAEEDYFVRKQMLTQIIYVWTGVQDEDPSGRGYNISDARKLESLEVITGRDFTSAYGANPVYQAGQYLEQAFDGLVDIYFTQLESQITYNDIYMELFVNAIVNDDGTILYDTTSLIPYLQSIYDEDASEGKQFILHFVENMTKLGISSMIDCDTFISDLSVFGEDVVHALEYIGDNTIIGTSDGDILQGEMGNDILRGYNGDDTYVFNKGDGQDVIEEGYGIDKIVFGEGISAEDIRVNRGRYELYFTNVVTGDQIKVEQFFWHECFQIESVEFADGTVWDMETILDKSRHYYGTETNNEIYAYVSNINSNSGDVYMYGGDGDDALHANVGNDELYGENGNDQLRGNSGDDKLYGESGDDTLCGENGNDYLVGGIGNDILQGGLDDDAYYFNIGDEQDIIDEGHGNDTIIFGEGIRAEDIQVTRDYVNLYFTNKKTGDQIMVQSFFDGPFNKVERVEFADGTIWEFNDIIDKVRNYYGTEEDDTIISYTHDDGKSYGTVYMYGEAGNDTLHGNDGNDEIYGGADDDILNGNNGNDYLVGGAGNDSLNGGMDDDTYYFNRGDGQDIIDEGYGNDTIVFGEGIKSEDIEVTRGYWDLYLTNKLTGDQITVQSFFDGYFNEVERVEFADGTIWDHEELMNRSSMYVGDDENEVIQMYSNEGSTNPGTVYAYGGNGDDTISGSFQTGYLYGEAGNDTISGYNGTDYLTGGIGNDVLNGGNGDDTYYFNLGDGEDIINEGGGTIDKIVFGEGIVVEDILATRDSENLYLTNTKTGDKITVVKEFYHETFRIDQIEFTDGTIWDYEEICRQACNYFGTDGNDNITSYVNAVNGVYDSVYVYGGAGNDILRGNNGDDEIYGEADNDYLYGNNGNDLMVGGTGNDNLQGGYGNDTYYFNLGDGTDTIEENEGVDKIVFGEGVLAEDIQVTRDTQHLYLTNKSTGDQVIIKNHFYFAGRQMESIEFADGTIWDYEKIIELSRYYYGTDAADNVTSYINSIEGDYGTVYVYGGAGNDILRGNNGDDEIYGEADNDYLYGNNGNDLMLGGTGNDNLQGGYGNDTYYFNLGDGTDTIEENEGVDKIVFGEGVLAEDIQITRDTQHLYLTNKATGDQIIVMNHFYFTGRQMESIEFADGTIWDYEKIIELSRYYYGTDATDNVTSCINSIEGDYGTVYVYGGAGNDILRGNNGGDEIYGEADNDYLYGNNGNDLIVGGTGNDNLQGGNGDDTYYFNLGDGQDIIYESQGSDQVVFGEDIDAKNLMFEQSGNDLIVSVIGQEDSITISNYFAFDSCRVESFCTTDGSVIDYTKLGLMIQAMASFEDTTGMMWEDAIESNNEQANDIVNQWWIKEAI